jgi:ethanolamine utilization cobalamin adenosyltransferase
MGDCEQFHKECWVADMVYTNPLKDEFDYYLAHQPEFVAKYNGKIVVIKEHKVIGFYGDKPSAIRATIEQGHPLGTFLVQLVSPGDEAYTQTFHSRVSFS